MLIQFSIAFLILGLIAIVFGLSGWIGLSFELGREVFFLFLALAIGALIWALFTGRCVKSKN